MQNAADPAIKNTKVIVHGYDYGRPMRLGWIGEPMEFVGIGWDRPELQNGIVKILIDALNTGMDVHGRTADVDAVGSVGWRVAEYGEGSGDERAAGEDTHDWPEPP